MFRAQRNGKLPNSGEKIDFKFSNFQAFQVDSSLLCENVCFCASFLGCFSTNDTLQVPKIWEKLLVTLISVETGKTIAKSKKALARNGNCQWPEILSESIWISSNSSKELKEHVFKFVLSDGSARSGILGEATVNIASYYTGSESSSSVSLPLKKCKYGTILQVTIQCLTPRTKLRVEGSKCLVDEDCDVADSRSNGSDATLNLKSNSPSSQDLAPNSFLEKTKIKEKISGSDQGNHSAEYSLKKEKLYPKSQINEIKPNINSNCKYNSPQSNNPFEDVSVSKSNNSSFKSSITRDEQEQEYDRSSPQVHPSSVMDVGSSGNHLEAARNTIEEVLEQALENNRISNSQTRSDLEKDYKTTSSEENVDILESKLPERKETEKNQMRETRWLKMKVSEQEARIYDLKKEKNDLQENMEISLNESNITSKYVDNLRNNLMMLSNSLDSHVSANTLLEQKTMKLEKLKREADLSLFEMEENIKLRDRVSKLESQLRQANDKLEKSESEKSDLQNEVKSRQNVENLLLNAQVECEYVKSEKKMLQESAENLIEECNNLQKSYEDMTNGNAKMYDQYSCLVMELTSETGKFRKEVKHLKQEICRIDEQKSKLTSEKSSLESSLKEVDLKTENDILIIREESESKIQDLTTKLVTIKQNHTKLMIDHENKSRLLTVSEQEHQQLIEEAANLKDEVLNYKQKLEKLKNEKSNLEASLHSVSNSFEKLKAEKMAFFDKMSEFEDCKIQKDVLEEKILKLEGDLTAKNASRLHDVDTKNKINRMKSANMQYQLKIQQLECEKNECLKKIEDLQLLSAKSKKSRFHDDNDYAAKMKMLKAELDEARNANSKNSVQLQKLKSERRNSRSSVRETSMVEGEVVKKGRFKRTKSSLETKLKDLRDRYHEMSLKYTEGEAERRDLVMQLKTNNGAKKMFQFLEKS